MDALSDVLKAVKLQGAFFFNGEFSAPWCFSTARSADAAPKLAPGAGHVIIFHFLTEGRAYARLPEGGREELCAGDIVIFPHGNQHFIGNGSPEKPVDSFTAFRRNLAEGLKAVRYGGGGEVTRFVCGFLACDRNLSEVFLSGLPAMLKVGVSQTPSGEWLKNSIRFSVDAAGNDQAGGRLVLARLSEVLFVETLRGYINSLPAERTGWLAGARDPVIGKALAAMHKDPAHPWTIASLAKHAGLSRTSFADRFNHFIGDSPVAYLTQWRLKLGAEMLTSTEQSVAEIAAQVGYASEASFNRAFKRAYGKPPARFRSRSKAQENAPVRGKARQK